MISAEHLVQTFTDVSAGPQPTRPPALTPVRGGPRTRDGQAVSHASSCAATRARQARQVKSNAQASALRVNLRCVERSGLPTVEQHPPGGQDLLQPVHVADVPGQQVATLFDGLQEHLGVIEERAHILAR